MSMPGKVGWCGELERNTSVRTPQAGSLVAPRGFARRSRRKLLASAWARFAVACGSGLGRWLRAGTERAAPGGEMLVGQNTH